MRVRVLLGAYVCFQVAFLACATAPARETTNDVQAPKLEVKSLQIVGASHISESDILESILTSESHLLPEWVPILGKTSYFDANVWQADLRRIERLYQARGYYQARVVEDAVDDSKPGQVRLRVKVEEGLPTHVTELNVAGLEALSPAQRREFQAEIPLKVGDIFLEEKWKGLKAKLASLLREKGYAQATMEGSVEVDVETRHAKVDLAATLRKRYRFGSIFVTGNSLVSSRAILDVVKTDLHPGDFFQESVLSNAQARVFQMGVFAAVRINVGAPDEALGTVPLVVDVREAPFRTQKAGVGLGLDRNRQELHAVGEYTHRNFFGGLRRYTLRGQAGYAFLPNVVSALQNEGGSQQGVTAKILNEFEQPRFLHPKLHLKTSIEILRSIEPAYNFFGGNLRIGLPFSPHKSFTFTFSYNLNLYLLSSPVPLDERSPELAFGCPLTCVLSYVEQNLEWDRRDDAIEPRAGYYLGLSLQEGGGPLQGAFNYIRLLPDLRAYQSFGERKRLTLAGKLKLGTLLSAADSASPIVARFFSGGGVSMRGFNTRRLSPLLAIQRTGANTPETSDDTFDTLPIGGNGLFESSVELRYNAVGNFVFATFLDAGFVTAEAFPLTISQVSQNMQYAVGLGIRYRTPLGPIRLDLAHRLPVGPPLNIRYASSTVPQVGSNSSCFGIGKYGGNSGSPEGWCTLHVSIGEAF